MVLWSAIEKAEIDSVVSGKDRTRFKYKGEPLRFQIPRGMCTWGVSSYRSFQVDVSNPAFLDWWRDLETCLCPQEPFNSNLKGASLRLKIDDSVYIFDENSKQVNTEVSEGLFRGQELSCLVGVESTYFFNGTWGLTCKAVQVRSYGPSAPTETSSSCELAGDSPVLPRGVCSFLDG